MGSRVREHGSGDSRRDGVFVPKVLAAQESPAGAGSLSVRMNLPE